MTSKRNLPPKVRAIITARARAKSRRDQAQPELISDREILRNVIRGKLDGLATGNQWINFCRCGNEKIIRTCKCCGARDEFLYRCSLKWCPSCNWRIAEARRKKLSVWAMMIRQPKHLVLTQRNFAVLTKKRIRNFAQAFAKLRRSQVFAGVRGGTASMEITNEGNGWHLHAHCLLDVDWLPMEKLSVVWGKLLGQEFGIVKVKDARGTDYLQEITKYVVKSSELAKWPPETILEFILAIRAQRFFVAFGSLFHRRREIAAILASGKTPAEPCVCGSTQWRFISEFDEEVKNIYRRHSR